MSGNPFGVTLRPVAPTGLVIPKFSVWEQQSRQLRQGQPANLVDLLRKIDVAIKQYELTFSPMARRNFAMAIQEATTAFIAGWKRAYAFFPAPALILDLERAAAKEADFTAGAHKYSRAVCIGLSKQVGKFDPNLWSYSNGTIEQNIVQYSSDLGSDKADSAYKIKEMKGYVDEAFSFYNQLHGGDPLKDETLKIFMGPEFYFRGIRGAYNIKYISDILPSLRYHTKDSKFSNWLFVFGTAIGATFSEQTQCRRCGKGPRELRRSGTGLECPDHPGPGNVITVLAGAIIDNVALIQKGGEDDEKNAYVIAKEYISQLDFRRHLSPSAMRAGLAATGYSGVGTITEGKFEVMGKKIPIAPGRGGKYTDERMGGAIFTIDGIKFGLEICLDHLNSRLNPADAVQIQLVPSAGAHLSQFACTTGGFAFNVDGLGPATDLRVSDGARAPNAMPAVNSQTRSLKDAELVMYDPVAIPW